MKSEKKVLIGCPTYSGMKYCDKEFFNGLKNLKGDYDILIVENSEGEDYFNELKNIEKIKVLRYESDEKDKLKRLIASRNMIIDYALENGYDYVFMMDSDVVAPENAIEELLDCDKDIVGGWYVNYAVIDGKTKIVPAIWLSISEEEFEEMKKEADFPDFIKSSEDLRARMTEE